MTPWKALGRSVDRGQRGYAVLAPLRVTRRTAVDAFGERRVLRAGEDPVSAEVVESAPVLRGFTVAHVFDVSQTSGAPLPAPPSPKLLAGEAPRGLGVAVMELVESRGYTVDTVPGAGVIAGANGQTHWGTRSVLVRADMDDAAMVKTLIHDPLTAPASSACCIHQLDVPPWSGWVARTGGEVVSTDGLHESKGPRDVGALVVAPVGEVRKVDTGVGLVLLDGDGAEVTAVTEFLASLLAGGASEGSAGSYAKALLRWWRFLAAVGVTWPRASRVETRDFVLWMRRPTKRGPGGRTSTSAYAPATINHNLAVLRGFYTDRLARPRPAG